LATDCEQTRAHKTKNKANRTMFTNKDRLEATGQSRRRTTTDHDDETSALLESTNKRQVSLETSANANESSNEEDDEGYSSDVTSSFDSDDDENSRYSQLFIEIVHGNHVVAGLEPVDLGKRSTFLANAGSSTDLRSRPPQEGKRKVANFQDDRHKKSPRLEIASNSSSPFLTSREASHNVNYKALVTNPDVINELCQVTQEFYKKDCEDGSPGQDLPQSEAQGIEKRDMKCVIMRPEAEASNRAKEVNDHRTSPSRRVVPGLSSPASVMTFREALAPTRTPRCVFQAIRLFITLEIFNIPLTFYCFCMVCRVVTLSFPPFMVVHANDAYCEMTGHLANDVLGLPLSKLLEKEESVKASKDESVMILHDRLEVIASQRQDKPTPKCFIKVSLVGPEREGAWSPEKEGEQVENESRSSNDPERDDANLYITHYSVEMEPTSGSEGDLTDSLHLVSNCCGILG